VRTPLIVSLLFLALGVLARAQDECGYFSAVEADKLENALSKAPTCKAAADKFDKCLWGSSADVGFARIVIEKCDKDLLPKLNKAERERYIEEMHLCNYEYEKQEGTFFISAASSCHVDVAARFSANPKLADEPMPRASFDCGKAKTPLENAICSDKALGRADIVLNRAYKPLLSSAKGEVRGKLIAQQKKWLEDSSKKCGVGLKPLSVEARACMKDAFELRFMDLDGCAVAGPEECLNSSESNTDQH
jgi:uncharacterized protein YecT (DUF1311 family)